MALLDGCRVLDLTEGGSMIAGRMLADLGADVVQVEAPGGSSSRALGPGVTGATWTALAANKRGIVLDLSLEAGRSDLERLVAAADILIESSNGALAAHGLGYDRCARRNPRLVYVSISPYGAAGPKAGYAATDLTVWAAGGPLALNRDDQDRPLRISSDQAFLHAGADAACGALVAYDVAERTGRGQLVDVSAQASLTICTLGRILAAAVGDDHPDPEVIKAKVDQSGSGTGTRRSKWPCADGLIEFHLAMGGAAGSFTNRFFAWMREEGEAVPAELDWDWTALPPRIESGEITPALIEQVRARVSAFLRVRTKAEVMAAAMSRRLLCVGIADTADLVGSEHFAARGFWCEMGEGTRRVRLPGRFVRSEIDLYRFRGPAPLVGEHDTEVRAEWEARPVAGAPAAPLPREGALAGLRVLDLSWVVAGPMVGRALADLGAEVIRVESRKKVETARLMAPFNGGVAGPENSALYGTCNAGKRGLSLDLSTPEGREVLRDLVRWADVVVESYAPGQMAKWGLDYAALRVDHEDLVMVSSSLMGQAGPLSGLAGFGNIGAALSGFQDIVGMPGELPIGPFGPYTDYLGPRVTLVALLGALRRRRATGTGCHLDVSQVEAGVYFLGPEIAAHQASGYVARPVGNRHELLAPHGVYRCAASGDGHADHIAIAVRDDADWRALALAMDRADLADDPALATTARRLGRRDDLDVVLGAWTAGRGAADVERLLQGRGVPAHVATTALDALEDAQLRRRGHFVPLAHPVFGTTTVEGPRFLLDATPAVVRCAAPRYGEDNETVLRGPAGRTARQIEELEAAGVLT